MDKTAIDDVVLGAPFDEDPRTADNAPHLPIVDSVVATILDPQQAGGPSLPQIEAGCAWDRDNWSCSYDTVFMSFWSVYKKSSPGWRDKWRQQAPEWNEFFGAAFDSLLTIAQDGRTSQAGLSRKFTSFRETFRDELSRINPTCFRRYGMVLASVCRILGHIYSNSIECEPYLNQVVACDQCGISMYDRSSFALLGSTPLLNRFLNEDDTAPFLPLQTAVTRYIQHLSHEPRRNRCSTCFGPLRVATLSIPEMAWLWIELSDPISPITPSPRLVFSFEDQRRIYTLQAVIYHGGDHFTARLSDRSARWWKYDGMWRFGVPRIDCVENETDLLTNDGRRASFLLYCQADSQD